MAERIRKVTTLGDAAKELARTDQQMRTLTPRWKWIANEVFTATPASTSRITMSDTTQMAEGLPLRYRWNDTLYYGIITAVSANAYVDLAGAPLNASYSLQGLWVGLPEMVAIETFNLDGVFANGAVAYPIHLLKRGMPRAWTRPPGRWVRSWVSRYSGDVPKVKVGRITTLSVTGGDWTKMSAAEFNVDSYTAPNIYGTANPDYYRVTFGQYIDFVVHTNSADAQDFMGAMVFVLE